jgi:hypothetical protein
MRVASLTTTGGDGTQLEEHASIVREPITELELVEEVSTRVLMCADGCVDSVGD